MITRVESTNEMLYPTSSNGKISVRWEANWMMCEINAYDEDNDVETIKLYAEVNTDYEDEEIDFDDYSYPLLKEEIIKQANENDIPVDMLAFHWD